MESFCIAVAKELGLPGFGDNVIEDMDGNLHSLNTAEDYYLRVAANMAWLGEKPVPEAASEDIQISGVERILPAITNTLKPEEVRRVAYIFTRGGSFAPYEKAWDGDATGPQWKKAYKFGTQLW